MKAKEQLESIKGKYGEVRDKFDPEEKSDLGEHIPLETAMCPGTTSTLTLGHLKVKHDPEKAKLMRLVMVDGTWKGKVGYITEWRGTSVLI